MATDRVPRALSRIEAAVDRIEARIARNSPAPPPAPAPDDTELAERHEGLRAGTAAALARLDRLLGTGEAD